jgi:hypothetical protein
VCDLTLGLGANVAIIVAAVTFAVVATHATGREGQVQQHAGFQCLADGMRQHGGAAVGVHTAGAVLPANQQQQRRWQHHCKERLDAPGVPRQGQLGQLLHLPAHTCQGGGIA